MERRCEKIAENKSRVQSLAKKSISTSCHSTDGWMHVKTGKYSFGEEQRHLVTLRKASFKTHLKSKYDHWHNKRNSVISCQIDRK